MSYFYNQMRYNVNVPTSKRSKDRYPADGNQTMRRIYAALTTDVVVLVDAAV
jgi:hypothetical protein